VSVIKKLRSPILCIIFVFISVDGVSAATGNRHIHAGAGWAYLGMRDKGLSPLYYSGSHALFESGYLNRQDSVLNRLDISFMTGAISPEIYPGLTLSVMKNMKGSISYSHMRYAGSLAAENARVFLGGTWKNQSALYRHNQFSNSAKTSYFLSQIYIDGLISLGSDNNGKRWMVEFGLAMPVVTFIIRPDYAYIFPAGFLEHDLNNLQSTIRSIEIAAPNRFFGLVSDLSLRFAMTDNHAMTIKYNWQYFGHQDSNQLNSATHGISLQTSINF